MTNKKQTAIYLSDEQRSLKQEIEQSLDGAKLTHSAIYNRGLLSFKELMDGKKMAVSLNEDSMKIK